MGCQGVGLLYSVAEEKNTSSFRLQLNLQDCQSRCGSSLKKSSLTLSCSSCSMRFFASRSWVINFVFSVVCNSYNIKHLTELQMRMSHMVNIQLNTGTFLTLGLISCICFRQITSKSDVCCTTQDASPTSQITRQCIQTQLNQQVDPNYSPA